MRADANAGFSPCRGTLKVINLALLAVAALSVTMRAPAGTGNAGSGLSDKSAPSIVGVAAETADDSGARLAATTETGLLHEATGQEQKVNMFNSDWRPPSTPKVIVPPPVDATQAAKLAEQWGVKLLSLRLSAAGYMMDFRFRVLDVEKALPLFDHRNKPYLVVERSRARLPVPMAAKVGSFRTTNRGKNIKPDKNYYMMFANPDRHVKAGEKVTLEIGDFKAEKLTVY